VRSGRKQKAITYHEWQQRKAATPSQEQQMLIQALKNIQPERASLDEMVELSAGAKMLSAEFSANGLSEPEWLSEAKRTLTTEIKRQSEDRLKMELREIEQAEAALETAAEKRQRLAARKAELQSKLGTGAAV
jgi:hypothetical protein